MSWIKIHNKLLDWEWASCPETMALWIHILLRANYEDKRWHGIMIPRGSLVTGRKELAKNTGLSEQQVRTSLNRLISTNEITISSTNKFSIVTICKYDDYQMVENGINQENNQDSNQRATNNQPTNNQQITNNQPHLKNVKKDKNVKNVKKDIYIGVPDELKTAFMEFAEMREAKKKPIMTENTVTRILNRLEKFASSTDEKIAILNQSTDHCWIDVYDLKDKPKKGTGNPYLDMLGDECE